AARATAIWLLNGGDRLVDVAPLRAALGALEAGAGLAVAGANLRRDGKFLYSVRPAVSYFRALAGANRVCHQAVVYDAAAFRRVGEFSTA
ncbi:hypothetical protein ACKI1L_37675, partial [Streptomyces scabiei]|uniref:hypothetical protein n=1 Tax=Streptomyces scabiei TaxID=1930 RepID=UPI0038F80952